MNLRVEAVELHPEFPFLAVDDAEGVASLLSDLGWLGAGESVTEVSRAGEGNMNLTLRVRTSERSVIVKQARPWVEKYDAIAAPWDRILFEQGFYERVSDVGAVASAMPRLLASDSGARVIMLEDLGDASDFTHLYSEGNLSDGDIDALAGYVRALHDGTRDAVDPEFVNRDMRALNHEHIFCYPLNPENGLALDEFEPGLSGVAGGLMNDEAYRVIVKGTGERYLSNGTCLLHGDFFPGSWLRTDDGIKVIDPEFCYFGDPEFDLGVFVAHLCLTRQPWASVRRVLSGYGHSLDSVLLARYAGIEVMRRLIGVAQLPIPASDGMRATMLGWSRSAVVNGRIEELWSMGE